MDKYETNKLYFDWMTDMVCHNRYSEHISYNRLLNYLHYIDFRYSIPRDLDRAEDGKELRYRFALMMGDESLCSHLNGQCSVLEMMIALSIRCEENIMDDPSIGNRTGQWFWGMIVNLGLGAMTDDRFDRGLVDFVITRFLDRKYEPDGRGGLFTIKNCTSNLRNVEIWNQLCWYLDDIV